MLSGVVLFAAMHAFVGPLDAQACINDIAEARQLYEAAGKPDIPQIWFADVPGYISAFARRVDRPVEHELVRFRRREQMNRLRHFFAGRTAA